MKASAINYITEQINESNYIELYKATVEALSENNTEKYTFGCKAFTDEVTELFDYIADEIKNEIGIDTEGYEIEDFDYNIGNGQISCYMFISLGVNDFEIRLSDHSDNHNCGNRIQRSVLENDSKKHLINSIIKEVSKL